MMKTAFVALLVVLLFQLPSFAQLANPFPDLDPSDFGKVKLVDSISVGSNKIFIGMKYDDVVAILPREYILSQLIDTSKGKMIAFKKFKYGGKMFILGSSRAIDPGPYVVTYIGVFQ